MAETVADILGKAGTRLGFGCGELYAGSARAQSLGLIEAAIDNGVVYFDTARLYGHGEAEALLGAFMARLRDRIVLTSKAGILPTHNPFSRRALTKAALIARRAPALRRLVPEPRPAEPTFGVFAPARLRKSVETSLRALRTDRLDLLLLHECSPDIAAEPGVRAMLEALRREGKIRGWGVATGLDATLTIAAGAGAPLYQFASSAWAQNRAAVRAQTKSPLIVHSVLGRSFHRLIAALREDERLRASAAAAGFDPDDAPALAQALLGAELHANADGIVLFSTANAAHLRASAAAAGVDKARALAAVALARLSP